MKGMKSERKECGIKLLFSDKTQLKISVQSIHQVFELSITIRGKLMQKEDFATNRIVHRVGKVANLIEHLVGFVCPYTIEAL